MIIGLNGKIQSGKDTTYGIIKELRPEAERITFAAKLKESAAALFGIDPELWEIHKNDDISEGSLVTLELGYGDTVICMTIRELLQRYGTEAHRNIFGNDFWIDACLPVDIDHDKRLLVVTDMRFPNEIDRVIELGGFTVRLNRMAEDNDHKDHASEQDINDFLIDWELANTGTIADLKENVEEMLIKFEESC